MKKKITQIFSLALCLLFIFEQTGLAQNVAVLDVSGYLAKQHSAIALSNFRPLHLRYLQLKPNDDNFKLLIDKGTLKNLSRAELEGNSRELLKYFLIGLTLPNSAFWVNLRPDSPEQIIDSLLGETDIGKILLEADLELKKDTALATSPATPEGAEYWDKLYKKAAELFGSENITIPTLTRPWIVPDEIILSETPDSAYIHKAALKVMLEQDYLKNDAVYNFKDEKLKQLNEYSSQLIRELIIPKLNQQINTSKKYASLRQVYYSLILAQWFKARFAYKQNPYSYLIETRNLSGLTSDVQYSKNTYFKAYQESFKNGEYNYKTPVYTPFGQSIRSYFSGGADFNLGNVIPAQFGGIAVTNANGTQMCVIASSRDEATLRNNPYLLAAEGKISLGELVVRITGSTLSEEEIQRRVRGIEDAHQIELDDEHRLGQRNPDGTYQEDEDKPYSFSGIREKAEILRKAGFGEEQRRSLMQYGLAGRKEETPNYFSRLKEGILNLLKPKKPKDITKVNALVEELNQQGTARIQWPDSYLRFIAEQGDYLIAANPEDTVRWNYVWRDNLDEYGIRKALTLLGKLKLLGHGTIGLKNLVKEEDYFDTPVNFRGTSDKREYLSSIDFIGAVSLLNVILTGEIQNASVQQFADVYQGDDKLYYPNFYGPFFVVLKPGAEKLKRFSDLDVDGHRFGNIGIDLHYLYLVPRLEDKEFFIKVIERAVKEGLITRQKAQEAILKLKTVTEFIEDEDKGEPGIWQGLSVEQLRRSLRPLRQNFERYRGRPIRDTFKGLSWSARLATWFNATRKIIADVHKKIVVYYPGAASDLLYALLATDGDTFIFVDKDSPAGKSIPGFITKQGGEILSRKQGKSMYYLRFRLFGKTRELYYYYGVDAGDETQLPKILRDGYNVYIERHFVANSYGGFKGDFNSLWRTNLKYLLPGGFTITDYPLINWLSENGLYQIGYTKGGGYSEDELHFCIYLPGSLASSPASPIIGPKEPIVSNGVSTGGIDFRSLPIVTQAIGNLSMDYPSLDKLAIVNLNEEWGEIERLVSSGITPSVERIKGYLQASCVKGDIEKDIDRVSNYISDILRQEEGKCCYTDSALKDILIVLEANRSSVGLKQIFLGKVN